MHPFTSADATMNAKLVARNPKDGFVTLYVEYRNSDKFKRIPTGFKIGAKYFNAKAQRITAYGTANVERDNKTLTAQCDTVNAHIRDFHSLNGRWPSCEELGASLEAKAAPAAPIATEQTLVADFQQFIEYSAIAKEWAPATVKGFKTLLNNIIAYNKAKEVNWLLSTIEDADIVKFQQWALDTYKYNNATLAKRIRLFRQYLIEKAPPRINIRKVKAIYSEMLTPPVVLYRNEIEALRNYDLSEKPRLERVRDLQQVQIFSGLRFSDLITLSRHHIQNGYIVIKPKKTIKTGKQVKIPIFPQLQQILNKYTDTETGELELPIISSQKFNDYLKELCALIPELQEPIMVTEKIWNNIESNSYPKFSQISSHSSRRSFISLCLSLKIYSIQQIMNWSGHSSLASFQRYIGDSEIQSDAAQQFAKAYEQMK